MVRINRHVISFVAIFWLIGLPVYGQQPLRMEWSLAHDNDLYLFNRQDQYYTNGILLSFRKAADSTRLRTHEHNRTWSVYAGQKLYTAYTGQIHTMNEVDRPITAYLFAGANLAHYYTNESVLSLSAELGTIGRRALGKQAQEVVHRVLHLYEIAGWEYQLENAFGADISAEYARKIYRNPHRWFDVTAQAVGTLGLTNTRLSVAPTFRLGRLNRLHSTAYFSSRLQSRAATVANELFFYYKPQLSWVGYDATIQGGLFRQDKGPVSFRPARWVFANQVGVMYAHRKITCSLQYIFSTKESSSMFFRHQYGSLGVSFRY